MYSLNKKNYDSMTTDDKLEDIPSFMQFFFSPSSLNPSEYYETTLSYLYDELDNDLFEYYLKKILNKNKIEHDDLNHIQNKSLFMQNNNVKIFTILKNLLDKTTITTKREYKLKDYYLSEGKISENIWILNLNACLHKPDRAYGKIIELQLIYKKNEENVFVQSIKLIGIVPQQNITDVKAIFINSYDKDFSYL